MTGQGLSDHFPLGPVAGEFLFEGRGRRFVLLEPFLFVDGDTAIEIPVGFETDFNSVPRGLWNVFPPWEYPEAGVVHDWLYRHPDGRTRGDCDGVHRRILHLVGCGLVKRLAAWSSLRTWGWIPWRRYRKAEHA